MVRELEYNKHLINIYEIIGNNIARLRGRMKQRELAEKAKVSRQTLGKIENGQPIALNSIVKIANALDVPVADFFITDEQRGNISYMHIKLMERIAESFGIKPPRKK